jgi:hypothetical protein
MLNWNKVAVRINNTGIMAQSASLSNQSNLTPIFGLGYKGGLDESVNGPQVSEVSIAYIPKAQSDPFWGVLGDYKTANNISPVVLTIGGISGSFYMTNYSISFQPNTLVSASASFRSFNAISGEFQELEDNTNENIDFTGFFNGYTTNVGYNTFEFQPFDPESDEPFVGSPPQLEIPNLYNLSYNTEFELNPIYPIGFKEPSEVQINGGNENFSFVMEEFRNQGFSGAYFKDLLNFSSSDIKSFNMGFDFTSNQSSINIDFTNGVVDSSSFDVGVGAYLYTTFNVTKQF